MPVKMMSLGRSGLKVSEISYGNWITHGSQVEEETARACVRTALDLGITTFDTADVYAGTRADNANNPNCGCSFVSSRTAVVQSGGGYPGACSCRCTGDQHLSAPASSSNEAAHQGSI